jgi:CheY-like chemotaxis protein
MIEETNLFGNIKAFINGSEAINFLKGAAHQADELPDIILLDINMPVMDGWEFLDEFVLLQPLFGKKIILYVVSSSISPNDMDRAKAISAVTDYVIKPVTKEKFTEMMKVVVV